MAIDIVAGATAAIAPDERRERIANHCARLEALTCDNSNAVNDTRCVIGQLQEIEEALEIDGNCMLLVSRGAATAMVG